MPSNEQRREAAKRKLERQMERRAKVARKRKQLNIAGSVLAVLLVAGAGTGLYFWKFHGEHDTDPSATAETTAAEPEPDLPKPDPLPVAKSKAATVNCTYTKVPQPAARAVQPPTRTQVPTSGANAQKVSVSMTTNRGNIGLTLNNAESPCTVNSFLSLASQGYFNDTPCHRMTTSPGLKVLQCGDPKGTGTNGPGYQFANEYPTDQYPPNDPHVLPGSQGGKPVDYHRGLIAMANSGADTNGSQFFLVYGNSLLPAGYTIFGTIDEGGLKTLDKVAAAGVIPGENGPGDGAPKDAVKITSVAVD